MHGPNEHFCLATFFRGIEASIHFLAELGRGEALWMIAYGSTRHVGRHRGTLPVVLACPHDGGAALPVPERTGSEPAATAATSPRTRDRRHADVTTGIAQRLLELRGEAPYVIFADFHRKYVDVNRSADCAYEAEAARPYYEEYHRTLRGFLDEVRAENGGQRAALRHSRHRRPRQRGPADLYLGTVGARASPACSRSMPMPCRAVAVSAGCWRPQDMSSP